TDTGKLVRKFASSELQPARCRLSRDGKVLLVSGDYYGPAPEQSYQACLQLVDAESLREIKHILMGNDSMLSLPSNFDEISARSVIAIRDATPALASLLPQSTSTPTTGLVVWDWKT